MASPALDGASKYLNNLLLARGFLTDGKSIDFTGLANNKTDDNESNSDNNAATTARVINLIHDLVLRRDRDAEHRETLATAIQNLRADEAQRVLDLQRLQDKNVQLKNEAATAEAQQRTLSAATKRAQAETRELKEQMVRMKSTLDQVRAKCISDIRKRDIELEKLKNHLSGLNRGKKESATGGMKINVINVQQRADGRGTRGTQDANSSQWSLENETNDFLAAVVNETSTENVALRKIVGDSMKYLKALTGLEEEPPANISDKAIGIPGQYRDQPIMGTSSAGPSQSLIPVQQLASSMSEVLSHCQTILRDPSFVPIEEVQLRDEEITKLKAGWEKMADRWKEAVTMMSQWRSKMVNEQEHHFDNAEQPPQFDAGGLSGMAAFGRSIARRPDGQPILDPIEEEELTSMLMDHPSRIGNHSTLSAEADIKDNQLLHDDTLPEPDQTGTPRQPTIQIHEDDGESDLDLHVGMPQQSMKSPARRGVKLAQKNSDQEQPLSNNNANAKKRKTTAATDCCPRKRRSTSPTPHEHATVHITDSSAQAAANSSAIASTASTDPLHLNTLTSDFSGDEVDDDFFLAQDPVKKEIESKIPRMTVAQKLAAVEAEASEATEVIRRRQATTYSKDDRRAKDRQRKSLAKSSLSVKAPGERNNEHDKQRGKVRKAKDRRRSTLTPAELGNLMGR